MMDVMVINGEAKDYQEALQCSGKALYKAGYVHEDFADACIRREKVFPTGLPTKIPTAIPHTDAEYVDKDCLCFLRLSQPVSFVRMDCDELVDCRLIVNMALCDGKKQVQVLGKLVKMLQNTELVQKCLSDEEEDVKKFLKEHIEL